jgi:hypothetical protein
MYEKATEDEKDGLFTTKKSIVPPAPKILGNIKENLDSIVRGRSSPVKNLTRKRQRL